MDIATAVLVKAQEKGINPLKWQSHITMLSTFVSLVTEYLPELFDKPLPYKITSNKHDWKKYEFSISRMLVKVAIIDYDGIGNYEVAFAVDGLHDITGVVGTAAAIKIFTTVVAIILDFVKAVQPNEVEFTAAKHIPAFRTKSTGESRINLYDRMAKRLTPKGYEYSSKLARGGSETIYTFRKKEVK